MRFLVSLPLCLMVATALAPAASAGEADVIAAKLSGPANGAYSLAATIRHDDAGWKHYCDKFDVVAPDGRVLGTRILYHPHVEEQPFTRSLTGLKIPKGIEKVTVRAHDKVHGYGGRTVDVQVGR